MPSRTDKGVWDSLFILICNPLSQAWLFIDHIELKHISNILKINIQYILNILSNILKATNTQGEMGWKYRPEYNKKYTEETHWYLTVSGLVVLSFNLLLIETWVTCPMSESVMKSHQRLLMCIVFLWLFYCASQALFVLSFWSVSLGFNPLYKIRIEWKTMQSRGGFRVLMYCLNKTTTQQIRHKIYSVTLCHLPGEKYVEQETTQEQQGCFLHCYLKKWIKK